MLIPSALHGRSGARPSCFVCAQETEELHAFAQMPNWLRVFELKAVKRRGVSAQGRFEL
jgi:hypothetical protein